MKIPTLRECEVALKEPASAWAGRCYEIACKIVDAGLVSRKRGIDGAAVYGHWVGKISPLSRFADRRSCGFCPHGWIYSEAHDLVIDPTRWAFENKAPYLYVDHPPLIPRCKHCQMLEEEHDDFGANAECGYYEAELWPYDEGGNQMRAALRQPPPKPKRGDKRITIKLSVDTARFVDLLLGGSFKSQLTDGQLFWLANAPYQTLAANGLDTLREIYEAIAFIDTTTIEWIPLDNRTKATREAGFRSR